MITTHMCGICGIFSFGGVRDEDLAIVAHLMKLMERRGPDDRGLWSDDKNTVFGFQRLSILDLSPSGHQPMASFDGRHVIVYNGEVYNFEELREELQRAGLRFRSTGDSEVVLNALVRWGKDALKRFNGMFALAFYDVADRRMLLARDHAGIKPLYFFAGPKGLVFGSQYDQILSHPWARDLPLSQSALALYLRLGYIPAPYALLQNTHMLEPGSWLELSADGRIESGKFFEFPVYQEPDLRGEQAYEVVNEAITRAVRRHLISDVTVGTFLSGGIDSPLVAAKAAVLGQGKMRAFTIGTDDELDESADAAAYSQELGLDHVIETAAPGVALQMLDDAVAACSEPFADYSIFPTMLIARMARRQVKVILSGDGGDELFWGYPSRFLPVMKHARNFAFPYWIRMGLWGLERLLGGGNYDLRYLNIGECYRAKHTRIYEDDLHDIFPGAPQWPVDFDLFAYSGCEPTKTAQWMRWNEFVGHLTMVLLKVDRASMYHSLEVRVPLLDREVIDIAGRVDWRSCLDLARGVGKLPLRNALARHVRSQVQTKRGFEIPMNAWLRGPLRKIFQESILERAELLGVPINQRKLRLMFDHHVAGRADYARSLWTLLSLGLWERKHYNRISKVTPPAAGDFRNPQFPNFHKSASLAPPQ